LAIDAVLNSASVLTGWGLLISVTPYPRMYERPRQMTPTAAPGME
jgi:hypothetical protein